MIVQCEACQTRFRLADEKVKPGGTKVRCSKCKEIFTVMPPEPEPAEETVDFGSFNMEAVTEDSAADQANSPVADQETTEDVKETAPEPAPEPEVPAEAPGKLDFSGLEADMGDDAGTGEELADDFSFADTSQAAEDESSSESFTPEQEPETAAAEEEQTDFAAAFEETESGEDSATAEFDFAENQDPESIEKDSFELESTAASAEEPSGFSFNEDEEEGFDPGEISFDDEGEDSGAEGPGEFSFDDAEEDSADSGEPSIGDQADVPEDQGSGEFSFGDEDDNAFSFDDAEASPAVTGESDEFSFDDESSFSDDSPSEWGDDASDGGDSFDFEEPQFDTKEESSPEAGEATGGEEGGLQFGEIDFASDGDETGSAGAAIDDDFSGATMETQSEPELFTQQEQTPPQSHEYDDDPLPAPPKPKKSSLSRILLLLVLLLVVLGGAAGFMFMQGGAGSLGVVTEYLPFLEEYIGGPQEVSPADSIDINISGSAYVNNQQVGQMLVINGAAVNKHPSSRSSITIKGVLLDAQGKTLLQQTVFCGNQLADTDLESLPFKDIEEAMNNEFGAGLSNMNVAAGASIPFTIVFRNLPEGIANINVEVVDSKPGAN